MEGTDFSDALHKFSTSLCQHIANHMADPAAGRDCAALLLEAIHEAQATLLLCELECERLLHHG